MFSQVYVLGCYDPLSDLEAINCIHEKEKQSHTIGSYFKTRACRNKCPGIPEESAYSECFLVSDTTSEDKTISFKRTVHNLS